MNETFFDRLELELRTAAERPPRRLVGGGRGVAIALAVTLAIALALIPAAVLLGGGGDAALREPAPDRPKPQKPHGKGHRVVATGRAPVAGAWQLEVGRGEGVKDPKTGEVYEPAGLPCLYVFLHDPAGVGVSAGSGFCGTFRKTPGFTRLQHNVPSRKVREVLLFGRVPARAKKLLLTAEGVRIEFDPIRSPKLGHGAVYLRPVKTGMKRARINWLDAEGRPGSRGISLMPPASGRVKR